MWKLALSPLFVVASAFAQPKIDPQKEAAMKAGLTGPIDAMKKRAQVMVDRMVALLSEFRAREIGARVDHH